jgi:exopolyphosphatase/guanosine-5'-triphosphate,3'-diphosphate pyrophosphatase
MKEAAAGEGPFFAALDLGTNNCRLLIAAPDAGGFRIVDAFSRIVRLGEGVSRSGRLGEAAMERAIAALTICGDKIRRRGVRRVRAVATQACRSAANGQAFLAAVAHRTGLELEIISPREEAELAVAGCLDLLDPGFKVALVLDVGGGSTELSWIDLTGLESGDRSGAAARRPLPVHAWHSIPIGVVTIAERFPETPGDPRHFQRMVEAVKGEIVAFAGADALRQHFVAGQAHIVGTSGAITSLAGLHLRLRRYDRSKVDGLWMSRADCDAVAARLAAQSVAARAAEPCIGPDRADLVLAGAAILHAVQELWPADRVRVADRGLREGLLLSLIAQDGLGHVDRPRAAGGKGRS